MWRYESKRRRCLSISNLKITASVLKIYTLESVLVEVTDVSGGTFKCNRTISLKNYKILNANKIKQYNKNGLA